MTGEVMGKPKDDYFAVRLLEKLDETDPVFAAYEAQDVSREVGFDFPSFQAALERALDEIRETLEASLEEGEDGRKHYGDEMADIIFSLVNLARHAGISTLPTFQELAAEASSRGVNAKVSVNHIGDSMRRVGKLEQESAEGFQKAVMDLFREAAVSVIELARAEGYDSAHLLTENVRKYLIRCRDIETLAAQDGKLWADLAVNNEITDYWKRAKLLERQ